MLVLATLTQRLNCVPSSSTLGASNYAAGHSDSAEKSRVSNAPPPSVAIDGMAEAKLQYICRRFEQYDFASDQKFQSQLATPVDSQTPAHGDAGKGDTASDLLTRLCYFNRAARFLGRFVMPLTLQEYTQWKMRSAKASEQARPAGGQGGCPFASGASAHMAAGGVCPITGATANAVSDDTSLQNEVEALEAFAPSDTTLLVRAAPKHATGRAKGGLEEFVLYEEGPLDKQQLDSFAKALYQAGSNGASAVLITSDAGTPPAADSEYMTSDRIMTHDWRIFANGMDVAELDGLRGKKDYRHRLSSLLASAAHLEALIGGQGASEDEQKPDLPPPVILAINGRLHPTAMGWLANACARVCTEHALLVPARPRSDVTLATVPVSGLYTLSNLRGPQGVAYYLMFNPTLRLRAPDLLDLGLVDRFVPELRIGDWLRAVRTFVSDPDISVEAVQTAALHERGWPGCGVVGCWKDEIESCFGKATSAEDMLERLEKLDKPWTRETVQYIRSLPPLLVRLLFEAIRRAKDMDKAACARLEQATNIRWAATKDADSLARLTDDDSDEDALCWQRVDIWSEQSAHKR
ncbi:hypothetical protein THASP1DRAFT_24118 [Thamnocephalis sphaerospora]|uniref:Uncharacterized protein n=1 Tax=Thamnocephalis sphaerospora TaxID=78915 RepID=A0A4P9XP71_9FUNG|nr:hypothetical protein THASP1DRAFT_24118 [Thamnocephalis sphaerospora]|eukprot:RKP07785.1 hypothetical protein THASP1DRAFT_24118 [Thamnocephalis sphaerospora]